MSLCKNYFLHSYCFQLLQLMQLKVLLTSESHKIFKNRKAKLQEGICF